MRKIVHRLAKSTDFEGRPDRQQVEAALERITHRMLVQREWSPDEMRTPAGATN